MHNATAIELKRDCEATEIPAGTVITLPPERKWTSPKPLAAATPSARFRVELFRIAPQNADALGIDHAPAEAKSLVRRPSR